MKKILMQKGMTQIELCKEIGASYSQVSRQMNKHFLLPEKYLERFCAVMEIKKEDLLKAMNDGGHHE